MILSGEEGGIHKAWSSGEIIGAGVGATMKISRINLYNVAEDWRTFRWQHALDDRLLDLLFADKILGEV